MTLIGIACEDNTHFGIATKLVDNLLSTNIHWLRDVLDSNRTWCGLDDDELW